MPSTSSISPSLQPLQPTFSPAKPSLDHESAHLRALISHLNLQPHVEGGYFVETDRETRRVPNPFTSSDNDSSTRCASTTIHYLLTPASPLGAFHRNRGRTVHTLHKGRARYVIIHADEVAASDRPGGYGEDTAKEEGEEEEGKLWSGKARVETFVVGQDVLSGERLQWIVGSGKYKAEMLLPDEEGGEESKEGCLISETVVPGFEFEDHDFLKRERAEALLTVEQVEEMGWMLRRD